MAKKMNILELELRKMAITYLSRKRKYGKGYVEKRMATKRYPREWDTIIAAYEAGAYECRQKLSDEGSIY